MHDELVSIALQQEGLLSAAQIHATDLTRPQQRRLVTSGWLRRVAPLVYEIHGVPTTRRYRLRLGLLSLGERSWVSYEAAAGLHGLDRSNPEAVEFTVPRNKRRDYSCRSPSTPPTMTEAHRSRRRDGIPRHLRNSNDHRSGACTGHPRRIEAAIDSAVRLGPLVAGGPRRRLGDATRIRPVGVPADRRTRSSTREGTRCSSADSCSWSAKRDCRGRDAGRPSQGRTADRPCRFPVRRGRRRRGGLRPSRPFEPSRTGPRRAAPERTPRHRSTGLRIHVGGRHQAAGFVRRP